MSDGNLNTQLLSHGGFASGVRAGEARMKQKSLKAMAEVLHAIDGVSTEKAEEILQRTKSMLDKIK